MPTLPVLNTVTTIRRRVSDLLGQPVESHQVAYAIEKLNLIPVGQAGRIKVYSEEAVDLIRQEIHRIIEYRASSTAVGTSNQLGVA